MHSSRFSVCPVLKRPLPHMLKGKWGRHMQRKRQAENGYARCYRQTGRPLLTCAGIALAGLGALLLFLCVPGWAWVALLGFALICTGLLLLRLGKTGR